MNATATCPHCGKSIVRQARGALTPRQHRILVFVVQHIDRKKVSPSFEEIRSAMGYTSLATVAEHVEELERKGWIARSTARHRGIVVLEYPKE